MSHPPQFWCSRRLLVTVEGPQGKTVMPLARPFARIGRQPGSDIVLSSSWVAKRSLYLHATDEGVFCFYLQPEETHTQRLGYWLAPSEPLLVGPYKISACLEGDAPGPAPVLAALDEWGSAPPPYPVFQIYSGGKLRDKRKFRARLNLIGRRHECALQIKGQLVSAFHGCLYWHQARLWYVDLASSNGTSLNGSAIDCGEVRVGDQLVVGEFSLQFQRLSRGTSQGPARVTLPAGQSAADMLPPDFDDDMPLELDDQLVAGLDEPQVSDVAGSSPVIPLEPEKPQPAAADVLGRKSDRRELAAPGSSTDLAIDVTALAPVQQTQQELAVLQRRVEELTQLTAQAGQNAAQQLAQKTREAFERERKRIAQELERRGHELAREKQALETQWQTASRELTTQVNQLRDEATLLARQRQAMEQSRLLWDAQRTELEQQLRSYAEQLQRLERGAGPGLPAPSAAAANLPSPADAPREAPYPFKPPGLPGGSQAASEANGAGRAMVPAATSPPFALVPRSHVVEAHVETADAPAPTPQMPKLAGLGTAPAGLNAPLAAEDSRHPAEQVLEGSLASSQPAAEMTPIEAVPLLKRELPSAPTIKGRRPAAKGGKALDAVTDRMVEREQGRQWKMLVLGVAISVAVVALAAALIVTAVLLR